MRPAPSFNPTLWNSVDFVVSDVDGVLTDGRLFVSSSGVSKAFHVADGMAVGLLKGAGIPVHFISGRSDEVVYQRLVLDLRVPPDRVHLNIANKHALLQRMLCDISGEIGRPPVWVYIGDDYNDLCALELGAVFVCPKSRIAFDPLQEIASYVTHCHAGEGVLREVTNLILKAKGLTPPSYAHWQNLMHHELRQ